MNACSFADSGIVHKADITSLTMCDWDLDSQ